MKKPKVMGPFNRPDNSKYWICFVDSHNRITIPKEIWIEQGWYAGDTLEFEVLENKEIIVRNVDALARKSKSNRWLGPE